MNEELSSTVQANRDPNLLGQNLGNAYNWTRRKTPPDITHLLDH